MFGLNKLKTQAANMVREGVVSAVYPEKHSCRVTFPDKNNMVSAELPVLTSAAFKNQSYGVPDVGERVTCLMTSNDEQGHAGYIFGSLYTSKNLPEESGQDLARLKFGDDAEIKYIRAGEQSKTSTFKLKFSDDTEIFYECGEGKFEFNFKFSDGATISYNNNAEFEIRFKDKSTITHARGDLEIDIKGEINISARGDVNIKGANIHLN